jgi:hypothetical protein
VSFILSHNPFLMPEKVRKPQNRKWA